MIKDIIEYNEKVYQLSTINIDGMLETMVFPIEKGHVSGKEVYCFRTFNAGESKNKHTDIYYYPEKYLSKEAIDKYLKSKEEYFEIYNIETTEKIPFPFQYMEKYLLGEMDYDAAIDSTIEEVYRLIEEYISKYESKYKKLIIGETT